MELSLTIDITVQDVEGNFTKDCEEAGQEFKERINKMLKTECRYYTFADTMKTMESIKRQIELKYDVLIIRNIKKHRVKR
jgi:hypothetical protein